MVDKGVVKKVSSCRTKEQRIPDTGLCEISEGNSEGLEYEIYEYC